MPFTLPPLSRRHWLKNGLAAAFGAATPPWLSASDSSNAETWILFSDTHIAGDASLVARDTCMAENLTRCVNQVLNIGQKPFGLIINGDCAYLTGEESDYATFGRLIDPLREAGIQVNCTLGNHDDRDRFRTAFTVPDEVRPIESKHVKVLASATMNWLLLDTLDGVNQTPGKLGSLQLGWLDRALRNCANRPTVVIGHHNPQGPVPEGKKPTGLLDSDAMFEVLGAHPKVKAFVYGHTHNWEHTRHTTSGIHLINLPPVAYVFNSSRPNGWVVVRATHEKLQLELRSLNPAHDQHGQKIEIDWA